MLDYETMFRAGNLAQGDLINFSYPLDRDR